MKAVDVMTPQVVTIRSDATIGEAARLMLAKGISGLPVVDASGKLVGMVTEGDFLRRVETGTEKHRPRWLEFLFSPRRLADEYVHTHGRRVDEVMSAPVASVDIEAPVEEIVALMERRRIKRVPVLRQGKLVGIVSRANLLQALATVAAEQQPAASDKEIRARLLTLIDQQSWAPRATLNVSVRHGVVHLWGTVFDEKERQALRVAAENVPGVKEVVDHLVWIEPMSGYIIEP